MPSIDEPRSPPGYWRGDLDCPGDMISSILSWTPEILLDEEYYGGDVDLLPHLPQLQSAEAWKAAYKPVMRIEIHSGLSQAIQRPDKLVRPMKHTLIDSVQQKLGVETLGEQSVVLKLHFSQDPGLRSHDFVFLSVSPKPWEETAAICISGIVHRQKKHLGRTPLDPKESWDVLMEVSQRDAGHAEQLGSTGRLRVILISSIASGYRIFTALCDPGHSELLMPHILNPGPCDTGAADIQPAHVEAIEYLSSNNKALNYSQKIAIHRAFRPLMVDCKYPILIHGPPGTGKTHTLSSMILAITMAFPTQAVHVTAPSNGAVREIAVRLLHDSGKTGLLHASQLCFFGNEDSVDITNGIDQIYYNLRFRRLKDFEIKLAQFKSDMNGFHSYRESDDNKQPSIPKTWEWRLKAVRQGCELMLSLMVDLSEDFVTCRQDAKQVMEALENWLEQTRSDCQSLSDAHQDLIEKAQGHIESLRLQRSLRSNEVDDVITSTAKVVFSTANAAGGKYLRSFFRRRPLIVLDEATQSVEPEMALLLRRNIRGLVAIGDPRQLPSVISHQDLRAKGFAMSMFERLLQAGSPFTLLDIQYRMHPAISEWPSATFYDNKIVDSDVVRSVGRSPIWQDGSGVLHTPYSFFNIPGVEDRNEHTRSYKNITEADIIIHFLKRLIATFATMSYDGTVEIACITGYTEQVQLLNHKLRSAFPAAQFCRTTSRIDRFEILCGDGCKVIIDIASVDAFQGQERDIVLFATTRANPQRNIGFLGDPRRLNVALTRARYMLKIFGNAQTLMSSLTWASLIQDARNRGVCRETATHLQEIDVSKSRIVAAKLDEKAAAVRMPDVRSSVKLVDGINTSADLDLDIDSPWKVTFTKACRKQMHDLDKGGAKRLVESFEALGTNLSRYLKVGDAVRDRPTFIKRLKKKEWTVLWSIMVDAVPKPDEVTEVKYAYSQVIHVWAFPRNNVVEEFVRCIRNSCKSYTDEFLDLCAAENWTDGQILPLLFYRNDRLIERIRCDRYAPQQLSSQVEELDLAKAYEFNPRVEKALIEGFLAKMELPFVLSAEENALVHDKESTFVIGRSGTGKTTVMVLKMFIKAESSESSRCPQLLLTASPKLCSAIKDHFRKLRSSWKACAASSERSSLMVSADTDDCDGESEVPLFQELKDRDFPLFWTFGYLLRVLDKSLPGQKFWGFKRSGSRIGRPAEVDSDRFTTHYLHKMPQQAQKAFSGGSVIFGEIQTVIKGSLQVVELGRCLSEEEYLKTSTRRDHVLTLLDMKMVYACYESYQALMRESNEWDSMDAVIQLYARCQENSEICQTFELETLAIDEVQDMNTASLALLKFLLNGPGAADVVHYAGDAAQVINSAANFRFADLKGLYFSCYLPHLAKSDPRIARALDNETEAGDLVPKLKPLTMNYRSVEPIVALGNAVLQYILEMFPASIDRLAPDRGLSRGRLPVFLQQMDMETFISYLTGTNEDNRANGIEFGADQCIIVRNAAAKQKVKTKFGSRVIVLDIKECKGLEFEDVILYDFFSDSSFQRWRVLFPQEGREAGFRPLADHALLFELKQLYVAVTRARSKLWIYDQSERGQVIREGLQRRHLVTILEPDKNGEIPTRWAKTSTPEEWLKAGLMFMQERDYQQALDCFELSGNAEKQKEARAFMLVKEASGLEGVGNSADKRQASLRRKHAAGLFSKLGMARHAAQQYQQAGHDLLSNELLMKAADHWTLCKRSPGAGQELLSCLNTIGSSVYPRLLSTLEEDWINRDDIYWQVFENFAYKYGEDASDEDVTRLANLLAVFEDKVAFLVDLDRKQLLDDLLKANQMWERLAIIHEERLDPEGAMPFWRLAGRNDVLEQWQMTETILRDWAIQRASPLFASFPETDIPERSRKHLLGPHPYFEMVEFSVLFDRYGHFFRTGKVEPDMTALRVTLGIVQRWYSRSPSLNEFARHLRTGSFTQDHGPETLGVYPAQFGRGVHLVSGFQRDLWAKSGKYATTSAVTGRLCLTTHELSKMVGVYCKELSEKTNQEATRILKYVEELLGSRPELPERFNLQMSTTVLIGSLMMRSSIEDKNAIEKHITKLDRLLFPIDPSAPRADSALQWLSHRENQDHLRRIIIHRQAMKHEASAALVVIALKWTCRERSLEVLRPQHISMENLNEAIRWSVFEPIEINGQRIRPLAQSAQVLRQFFMNDMPVLIHPKPISLGNLGRKNLLSAKPSGFDARSQLFILEKLFTTIVILTDRFHETVMPARLVTLEIYHGGQSSGIAALLDRWPGSHKYLDNKPYYKIRSTKIMRRELQQFLLCHLTSYEALSKITNTIQPQDRLAFVKRLIVLAICCCCSQNFRGREGQAAQNDLFSLQRLSSLGAIFELRQLKPVLGSLATAERQVPSFIRRLIQVASDLGDPLQAVIDPISWNRMNVTGSKLRADIPKVFLRVYQGKLETSTSEDFGDSAHDSKDDVVDPDQEEEDEEMRAADEDNTFEVASVKLEDLEKETRAAQTNPIVERYLRRWIQQYLVFQKATNPLTGADREVFWRLNRLKLRPRQRHALFSEACRALSRVSKSSFENGRAVSLWVNTDRHLLKTILAGRNKGNPTKWLKEFRAALDGIVKLMDSLRSLLVTHGETGLDPLQVTAGSDQLVQAIVAFDSEYDRIIDAFYKKKGLPRE